MKDRKIDLVLTDATSSATANGFLFQQHFDSYRALLEFMRSEHKFWLDGYSQVNEGRSEPINNDYLAIYITMQSVITTLEEWQKQLSTWDDNTLTQNINQLQSNFFGTLRQNWYWSGHAFVGAYLLSLKTFGLRTGAGFLEFVLNKTTQNIQRHEYLIGYFLGYEFTVQGSDVTQRKKVERASLAQIRTQLETAKNSLFGEVDELKTAFTEWESLHKEQNERLFRVQKYLGERKVRAQSAKFNIEFNVWQTKISELEHTYAEKLKLEKPAKYWKDASRRYGIQGGLYTLAIVILVVAGMLYFREFFLKWLSGKNVGLELNTIQGAILFGTFATVYAYLLKVLSKLAFSSLHLMRDAEEREQLTYLYLSLSNESVVDEKSRDIILQSLFSRTQTGLLNNDNGPTMPSINEFVNNFKGSR